MMTEPLNDQLDKILALADSVHEGEALVAVRKARQVLSRGGLNFSDLARVALSRQGHAKGPSVFSFLSPARASPEPQLAHLQQQIEDMRAQMQSQDLQLDFWRRRAADLELNLAQAQGEAERWKNVAREATDRMWEMGRSLAAYEDMNSAVETPSDVEFPLYSQKK